MLKGKSLLDYTNLFSPNETNDKIIPKHFREIKRLRWKKSIILSVKDIEDLKILKYQIFSIKH